MFSLDEALFLIWGGIRQIWELKMARVLCTRISTYFTCAQDGASLFLEQCWVPDGSLYILAEWRDG